MADDPRIQAVAEVLLQDYAREYDADHLTWQDFRAPAEAALAAADLAERLPALLAAEDRAVEFCTRARFEAHTGKDWDGLADWNKDLWRAEFGRAIRPVLAALREVAGL